MARNLVTPKGAYAVAEGLPDLQKRIADMLGRTVAGFELKKVWMRGAIIIRDQAKANASTIREPGVNKVNPKQPWHSTPGNLERAIYASYGPDSQPNVLVGVNYRKAPMAHWIEYGTGVRATTKSGADRGEVKARPYFRPALLAKRQEATQAIAEGYRELITRAAEGQ